MVNSVRVQKLRDMLQISMANQQIVMAAALATLLDIMPKRESSEVNEAQALAESLKKSCGIVNTRIHDLIDVLKEQGHFDASSNG